MHSQLALTEHASLNLAPLILLDPVGALAAVGLASTFPISLLNPRDPHPSSGANGKIQQTSTRRQNETKWVQTDSEVENIGIFFRL